MNALSQALRNYEAKGIRPTELDRLNAPEEKTGPPSVLKQAVVSPANHLHKFSNNLDFSNREVFFISSRCSKYVH